MKTTFQNILNFEFVINSFKFYLKLFHNLTWFQLNYDGEMRKILLRVSIIGKKRTMYLVSYIIVVCKIEWDSTVYTSYSTLKQKYMVQSPWGWRWTHWIFFKHSWMFLLFIWEFVYTLAKKFCSLIVWKNTLSNLLVKFILFLNVVVVICDFSKVS